MPPSSDTPHSHSKKAPTARRKTRPKFEVPAEAATPAVTEGWIYRAEEVPEEYPVVLVHRSEPRGKAVVEAPVNGIMLAGMGMFFLAIAVASGVSLAAVNLFVAPLSSARRMLN